MIKKRSMTAGPMRVFHYEGLYYTYLFLLGAVVFSVAVRYGAQYPHQKLCKQSRWGWSDKMHGINPRTAGRSQAAGVVAVAAVRVA